MRILFYSKDTLPCGCVLTNGRKSGFVPSTAVRSMNLTDLQPCYNLKLKRALLMCQIMSTYNVVILRFIILLKKVLNLK